MTDLRLVGYNIKSGQHGDEGLAGLADAIRPLAADLVALQEVDRGTVRAGGRNQTEELARRLELPYSCFGSAVSWPGGGEYGVALLSRHPIEHVSTTPLYVPTESRVPESQREPRTLLSATIVIGTSSLRAFVTHLGLAAEQRRVQAREIAAAVQQAAVHASPIVFGDFNMLPEALAQTPLSRVLTDAHGSLQPQERGTFPSSSQPAGPHPTGADAVDRVIIDYILVPANAEVHDARVVHEAAEASDHYPIYARVSFS